MADSQVEARSLLAIDVGTSQTRALLFDAVEGRYRFLGEGAAPTTVAAPILDASEGVRLALDELQTITGRVVIDADERLIMPSSGDGSGVDSFVATLSAGPPLKVFAVGLLEEISLESARHLLKGLYVEVVGTLSLTDRRRVEEQIDLIMRLRPDLILIAGGTENGATRSIRKLLEPVGLATYLLPKDHRPEILYVGNQAMVDQVRSALGKLVTLHVAPNIRPSLDVEQLEPARAELLDVYRQIRARRMQGIGELDTWAAGKILPTGTAFGRVVRFLSRVYDSSKGVLGVNVGAASTTVGAAFSADLRLNTFSQLGMGESLPGLLNHIEAEDITRWLTFDMSAEALRDYLYNRRLAPASVPATPEELEIDQALAREILRTALSLAREDFPEHVRGPRPDLTPWFEPIVAGGGILTNAPTRGQTLLMVLDGLQPTGITTVVLDQNDLSPPLGAAASVNPTLTVQVLESGTFQNLGTVIAPISSARPGTPVLHVRLVYEAGSEMKLDVKQGSIETLPLPVGQAARLHLQPLQRAHLGMGGPGRGGSLRVVGGALGIVIDARGRPLRLPDDAGRRRELIKKWIWTLGG